MAAVLASFIALYGYQVAPHAIWWCQVVTRGPWVVPGHCQGVARWFLGAKRMCWKVEKKVFLAPWHQEGWVLGVPLYVLVG